MSTRQDTEDDTDGEDRVRAMHCWPGHSKGGGDSRSGRAYGPSTTSFPLRGNGSPQLKLVCTGTPSNCTRQSHLLEGRGLRNAEGWVRRVSVICTMLVTPHWQREPERKPKGECAWGEERQFRGPCEPGAWVMGFPQGWRHVFPPGECCFSSVPCAWGSNIHVPFLLRLGF